MSKIKYYLEKIGAPASSIEKLLDEKSEVNEIELAEHDAQDIGRIHSKNHPDPKHNEKYIIDLKNLKAGVFKQLQKVGVDLGELSRGKVEEMDTETFLKSINDPLNGHIEKVKSSTDEKVSAELKGAMSKISQLQDELDNTQKTFSQKELEIRSEVDKEKQSHLITTMLNDLDTKSSWGVEGDVLNMIKENGRNKIQSLGIKIDDKGNLTNSNGGPATDSNGKIVRTLSELHKSIFQPAFKISNGQTQSNSVAGIALPDVKDAQNTNEMAAKMQEAGAI